MAIMSATGNITVGGSSVNSVPSGSVVSGIGSSYNSHNHINIPGNHTHTLTGWMNMNPALHVDMNYNKKIICVKEGKEVLEVKDGMLKLNEVDNLELEELLQVFQYIKTDYPNLYADLILKGIIK